MAGPDVTVVIGVYNEAEAIGSTLDEVAAALDGLAYEIVVVDDESPDGTGVIVAKRSAVDPRIRLLARVGERGLASACIAGYRAGKGRVIATCDGDGQHDPAHLRRVIDIAASGEAELAVASRFIGAGENEGLSRRRVRLSRLANGITRLLCGVVLTDPMSGLFAMRREVFEAAAPRLSGVGFKILADLVVSSPSPPKTVEVATRLRRRAGGRSKLDVGTMLELPALLAEKRVAGLLPARFFLFAFVGLSGVLVQTAAFAALDAAGLPFQAAQIGAIAAAMTTNFALNNLLTFRDRRLEGWRWGKGLLVFYAVCALGAAANFAAAEAAHALRAPNLAATAAGAILGGMVNYVLAARYAWARKRLQRAP